MELELQPHSDMEIMSIENENGLQRSDGTRFKAGGLNKPGSVMAARHGVLFRKNIRLKTRGAIKFCTCCETLVPVAILALLCIGAYYEVDEYHPDRVFDTWAIQDPNWARELTYMEDRNNLKIDGFSCTVGHQLIFTPDTNEVRALANRALNYILCPTDTEFVERMSSVESTLNGSPIGHGIGKFAKEVLFCANDRDNQRGHVVRDIHKQDSYVMQNVNITRSNGLGLYGNEYEKKTAGDYTWTRYDYDNICSDKKCLEGMGEGGEDCVDLRNNMLSFAPNQAVAAAYAALHPELVLGVVSFDEEVQKMTATGGVTIDQQYTIRVNHTSMADTGVHFANRWSVNEPPAWTTSNYYSFANIQTAVDAAIIETVSGDKATMSLGIKHAPWKAFVSNPFGNVGTLVALILSQCFVATCIVIQHTIVSEKELRIKEGLMMMGVDWRMYWLSWFTTHFTFAVCTSFGLALVGTYIFSYSNAGIMFLFFLTYLTSVITFSYALSAFFSTSRRAAVIGAVVYQLTVAPAMVATAMYPDGSPGWKWSILLPSGAIYIWGEAIRVFEEGQIGITSETINVSICDKYNITPGDVLGISFATILMYAALAYYLESVWPSAYGQKKVPWFFLLPSTYTNAFGTPQTASMKKRENEMLVHDTDDHYKFPEVVEPMASDASVAVSIHGLTKRFGNFTAVDALSLDMAEGHITGLLGGNGAGKTTTISMLTGLITMTGGSASIYGSDVATQMNVIRRSLGVCPQFDTLWPRLTVSEHIMLYGVSRGMSRAEVMLITQDMLEKVGLGHKTNEPVSSLSGGQKRKLSLLIALLGDPRTVFLDEPTSGMDPYSRRLCWKLLRDARVGKSMVLTTHFMDEVDVLADRVAIMTEGKLVCVGSTSFLKSHYGVGYHLIVEVRGGSGTRTNDGTQVDANRLRSICTRHVPEAILKTISDDAMSLECEISLPKTAVPQFPGLLRELGALRNALVSSDMSYGLTCTTLDDVFLKTSSTALGKAKADDVAYSNGGGAGNGHNGQQRSDNDFYKGRSFVEENNPLILDSQSSTSDVDDLNIKAQTSGPLFHDNNSHSDADEPSSTDEISYEKLSGTRLAFSQLIVLMWKRWLNFTRDMPTIVFQLILPAVFVLVACLIMQIEVNRTDMPSIAMSRAALLNGKAPAYAANLSSISVTNSTNLMKQYTGLPPVYTYKPYICDAECACPLPPGAKGVASPFLQFTPVAGNATSKYETCPADANFSMKLYEDGISDVTIDEVIRSKGSVSGETAEKLRLMCPQLTNYTHDGCHCRMRRDCGNANCNAYVTDAFKICTAFKLHGTDSNFNLRRVVSRGRSDKVPCPCTQVPDPYVKASIDHYLLDLDRPRRGCDNELAPCDSVYLSGDGFYSPSNDNNVASYIKTLHFPHPVFSPGDPTPQIRNYENVIIVNPTAYHSVGIAINSLSSAIYRLYNNGLGTIGVTNHPLPVTDYEKGSNDEAQIALTLVVAIFIGVGMSILSASYSIFLIWERANNAKHLQMVSGVPKYIFVASNWASDVILYAVPFALLIAVFGIVPNAEFHGENLSAIACLLVLFALAAIPLAYLLHYPFRSNIGGFMVQLSLYSLLGLAMIISSVVLEIIDMDATKDAYNVLKYIYRLLPHYCLSRGIYDIGMTHFYNKYASLAAADDSEDDGSGGSVFSSNGFVRRSVWDDSVTGYHFLFLGVEAIVYLLLVLVVEYGETLFSLFTDYVMTTKKGISDRKASDDDVLAEAERIARNAATGSDGDDVVLVDNLVKRYGGAKAGVTAVNGISFGVRKGECFGLLGVNGAGKTSTFRMVTSEYMPTSGDIYVRCGRTHGGSSAGELLSAVRDTNTVRKSLGYCPQFDGIHPNLTCVEHLRIYAAIRGYKFRDTSFIASSLVDRLQLRKLADRRALAGSFSGGNKRKLSVAIALVGGPPVVLLDEPSTGMDVDTKRFMWEVIAGLKDQAVILTSHSMEECERLCGRLGIMVAGEFTCLGGLQHLKSKFGDGYTMQVILEEERENDSHNQMYAATEVGTPSVSAMEKLKSTILARLPGTEVVEEHSARHVSFKIPGDADLPSTFEFVEAIKSEMCIEDYSLRQTSLEEIFLRFAGEQDVDDA